MLLAAVSVVWIVAILIDAFETMVMPRRVTRKYRFTRVFYRFTWLPYRALALALPWPKRRASMLALFGPASVLLLFTVWVVALILAFAVLHWSLETPLKDGETPNLFTNFYMSGVTFFTLGYGDVTAIKPLGRFVNMVEAGIGFGFLAMVISYLPVLSQAFSAREVPIGLLDARAGSPPTAGELLSRMSRHREADDVAGFLHEWEIWSAQVLESHLAFPVLSHYRSQHDNQSWLAAITAILDTCTVIIAAVEVRDPYRAQLTFAMSRHVLVDLSLALNVPPRAADAERFSPAGYQRLKAAITGTELTLRSGAAVDSKMDELRNMYEPFAAGLAHYLAVTLPPLVPDKPPIDNWQSSAWQRRTPGFKALGQREDDNDHFV